MDTGNKSLAQLAAEHAEEKYIPVDIAAKISGYTKEYIERLCRLRKVEYRLWNNEQYVVELESLISITHTILVSYEGITFINKEETHEDPAKAYGLLPREVVVGIQNEVKPTIAKEQSQFMIVGKPVRSRGEAVTPLGGKIHEVTAVPIEVSESLDNGTPVGISTPVENNHLAFHPKIINEDDVSSTIVGEVSVVNPGSSSTAPPVTHLHITDADLPEVSEAFSSVEVPVATQMLQETIPDKKEAVPVDSVPQPVIPEAHTEIPVLQTDMNGEEKLLPSPLIPLALTAHELRLSTENSSHALGTPSPYSLTKEPEHHLLILDAHPLMKSVAFNLVIVFMAAFGTFVAFTALPSGIGSPLDSAMTAAVGDVFSDEVVVSAGASGTVLVRPVFRDSSGNVHEYRVETLSESASSTNF